MIQAAHEYAQRFGNAVTAVVVDEAGAPIAVGRMDKAEPRTAELAFNKAYTAAFHLATAVLVPQAANPGCAVSSSRTMGASCPSAVP